MAIDTLPTAAYLGVWLGGLGHTVRSIDGRPFRVGTPWGGAEGTFGFPLAESRVLAAAWPTSYGQNMQGLAKVLHSDGWTLVSFWDRSGDKRYGSHSAVAMHCHVEGTEAIALARRCFPAQFKRIEDLIGEPVKLYTPTTQPHKT